MSLMLINDETYGHDVKSINKHRDKTFEDKKALDLFISDIDEFIELYIKPYKYVFIDEFHYAKQGGSKLKYIFDTSKAKLFISGSSSIDLTVQAVEYLVGRIFVFSLFPLDFEEFLSFRSPILLKFYQKNKIKLNNHSKNELALLSKTTAEQLKKYFQEYVIFGGYPRVVLSESQEEKKQVLKNIYNTYFLREVKDILGLVDDYKLSQMVKALALQIGGLIEYQEIANVSGLSYQTVKGYLNFLNKTFIAFFVKPYFSNKRTEIVKNPRVYFFDTGLRNYIANDFRMLDSRTDDGCLLENGLAMQLVKQDIDFNFWRTKQQFEIDFIVSLSGSQKIAIEVKKDAKLSNINTRATKEFSVKYPNIPIFFCGFKEFQKAKDFIFIPLF